MEHDCLTSIREELAFLRQKLLIVPEDDQRLIKNLAAKADRLQKAIGLALDDFADVEDYNGIPHPIFAAWSTLREAVGRD